MIRVQGPNEEDYYYRTVPDSYYYTEFKINNESILCYRTEDNPNIPELWNLELKQLYPNTVLI